VGVALGDAATGVIEQRFSDMKRLLGFIAVLGLVCITQKADAQFFGGHGGVHIDQVPHTTTHTDYYQHGNHVDAVQHPVTHYDNVVHQNEYVSPYSNGGVYQSQRPAYNYYPGQTAYPSQSFYPGQSQSYYPSGIQNSGQFGGGYQSYRPSYDSYPHTSTHTDYVPHTQTHTDYYQHNNQMHAVPHTTTHIDAVPHTTSHFHGH
jgi:hypothetical protein